MCRLCAVLSAPSSSPALVTSFFGERPRFFRPPSLKQVFGQSCVSPSTLTLFNTHSLSLLTLYPHSLPSLLSLSLRTPPPVRAHTMSTQALHKSQCNSPAAVALRAVALDVPGLAAGMAGAVVAAAAAAVVPASAAPAVPLEVALNKCPKRKRLEEKRETAPVFSAFECSNNESVRGRW